MDPLAPKVASRFVSALAIRDEKSRDVLKGAQDLLHDLIWGGLKTNWYPAPGPEAQKHYDQIRKKIDVVIAQTRLILPGLQDRDAKLSVAKAVRYMENAKQEEKKRQGYMTDGEAMIVLLHNAYGNIKEAIGRLA